MTVELTPAVRERQQITTDRLKRWEEVLHEADATPGLLLGVGHSKDGQLHLLIPKDDGIYTRQVVQQMLLFALMNMRDDESE